MAQLPPGFVLDGSPAAPAVDPIVKPADPYRAEDQQMQREAAERARQAEQRAAAAAQRAAEAHAASMNKGATKTPTEMTLEAKAEGEQKRASTIANIMSEVRDLYESDIKGQPLSRAFGAAEFIDGLPKNERFRNAANNILPLIRPLVAQTAKEGDSDKEMEVFLSYIPHNDDSDITIEQKFKQLEMLIGGMVGGKPPSEVLGQDQPVAAVAAPPADGGPPPNMPSMDPNFGQPGDAMQAATGDDRLVADPATQARVDAMLRAGASYADVNQFAVSKGMAPVNRQQYAEAMKFLRKNPNYDGSLVNARKYEPNSTFEKAVTTLGDNSVGAYVLGAGQFLTGNTLDNLAGDPERARQSLNIISTKHPTATAIGEISGGALAALTGEAGLARLGMGSTLGRGIIADSAMGAANGAGAADGPNQNRVGNALVGAGSATLGSLGGYGAVRAGQKGLNALTAPAARAMGRDGDVAPRQIANALKDDGLTPRTAASQLEDAQSRGSPMAVADLGENSRELLASVGRNKGEARGKALKFARDRQAAQLERIGESVRKELGPTANIREVGETFIRQAREDSSPLYKEAFEASGAGAAFPRLEHLLNRPSAKQAMARANRISAEEGVDPKTLGFDLDAQGEVVLTKVPSWQTLHYIKLGLDDIIEGYRDKTTGRLNLDTEGRAINGTLRAMLKTVDDFNPSYAAARSAYAGPARLKGAMEKGVGIMSRDPDDILANLRDMSPSEVEMYRLGARKGIMNMLESKGDFADKVNALIGTAKKREALSRVFGSTKGYKRLQDVLSDEAAMGQTYKSVATGSPTAGRMAFDEGAHENAKTAIDLATAARSGGLTGLAVAAWLRLSEAAKFGVGAAGDAARSQMADILSASTPEQLRDIAKQLRRPFARKRLKEISQRKVARGAADVTGVVGGVVGAQTGSGQ